MKRPSSDTQATQEVRLKLKVTYRCPLAGALPPGQEEYSCQNCIRTWAIDVDPNRAKAVNELLEKGGEGSFVRLPESEEDLKFEDGTPVIHSANEIFSHARPGLGGKAVIEILGHSNPSNPKEKIRTHVHKEHAELFKTYAGGGEQWLADVFGKVDYGLYKNNNTKSKKKVEGNLSAGHVSKEDGVPGRKRKVEDVDIMTRAFHESHIPAVEALVMPAQQAQQAQQQQAQQQQQREHQHPSQQAQHQPLQQAGQAGHQQPQQAEQQQPEHAEQLPLQGRLGQGQSGHKERQQPDQVERQQGQAQAEANQVQQRHQQVAAQAAAAGAAARQAAVVPQPHTAAAAAAGEAHPQAAAARQAAVVPQQQAARPAADAAQAHAPAETAAAAAAAGAATAAAAGLAVGAAAAVHRELRPAAAAAGQAGPAAGAGPLLPPEAGWTQEWAQSGALLSQCGVSDEDVQAFKLAMFDHRWVGFQEALALASAGKAAWVQRWMGRLLVGQPPPPPQQQQQQQAEQQQGQQQGRQQQQGQQQGR